MSTLELRQPEQPDLARWVSVLVPASQLAERIAGTEFVPKALRGKPDAITACIMYGDEIGVGPMQALAGIHVVEGRPQPSAELARALILRAGHTITVHDSTGTRCRISGLRAGAPESERYAVEWTLDMARSAGLLGRDNWRKYPRAMLLARATGDLARALFPDVVKGLGYVDETAVSDLDVPELEPEPAPEPRKAIQRRTRVRGRKVDDNPTAEPPDPYAGADAADRPPVAPRPPAPTRVDPEDRPLPGMPDDPSATGAPGGQGVAPDLAPEQAAPEPPPESGPPGRGDPEDKPEPGKIGDGPLRAIHAKCSRLLGRNPNAEYDRMARLALISAIVGRPVDSTRDLTRAEGYRALDVLDAMVNGEASWQVDDQTGVYHIIDLREPPDEREPPPPDPWAEQQAREKGP